MRLFVLGGTLLLALVALMLGLGSLVTPAARPSPPAPILRPPLAWPTTAAAFRAHQAYLIQSGQVAVWPAARLRQAREAQRAGER